MEDIVQVFKGSEKFKEYLESFATQQKVKYDSSSMDVSKAIFFHLIQMKLALFKHKQDFNRRVKTNFSETFQDIVAFYLKVCLPDNFEVWLEHKEENLQPDILILKDKKPHFVLEIKTTIGWSRNHVEPPFDDTNPIVARIKSLARIFKIPAGNIIYIFETPFNVTKTFEARYWDRTNWKPRESMPDELPFNQIKPLFTSTNPEHWKVKSDFSKEHILQIAEHEIVIPFESILTRITA